MGNTLDTLSITSVGELECDSSVVSMVGDQRDISDGELVVGQSGLNDGALLSVIATAVVEVGVDGGERSVNGVVVVGGEGLSGHNVLEDDIALGRTAISKTLEAGLNAIKKKKAYLLTSLTVCFSALTATARERRAATETVLVNIFDMVKGLMVESKVAEG